jgi:hypothetical protein
MTQDLREALAWIIRENCGAGFRKHPARGPRTPPTW